MPTHNSSPEQSIPCEISPRISDVELVDAVTLHEVTDPHRLALLAVAAWFGDVRLIDNIELSRS
ncbi:MAG: pantoate--beta-alanine ligase [Akkermansia sp.]|nr:pantoate--beta-alanine ligase [Akkermansia sp.]